MEPRLRPNLTAAEGRRFAFPVGGVFLLLAAIAAWRGNPILAAVLAAPALGLLLGGVFVPGRLGPVYRAWMSFAFLLSRVTTPVFMAIIYFLVILPTGIMVRTFGRNPIVRKPIDGSYWIPRGEVPGRRSDLKRQF
jgi:hypothetical protein